MARKKADENKALQYVIQTRVNEKKYRELRDKLQKSTHKNMGGLVREILYTRPVHTHIYDRSLDMVMEELAALRAEIRAIQINLGQMTRFFDAYPEPERTAVFEKIGYGDYLLIEAKNTQLLATITKLSKKWLSEKMI